MEICLKIIFSIDIIKNYDITNIIFNLLEK
nr:MAG TPA: hypothetical protein [Caudoviricetes sp.]